jgi:cytochrome bd-type quinol oxidase subunit 2
MALTSWKLYLDTHIFLVDAVDVIVYLAIWFFCKKKKEKRVRSAATLTLLFISVIYIAHHLTLFPSFCANIFIECGTSSRRLSRNSISLNSPNSCLRWSIFR